MKPLIKSFLALTLGVLLASSTAQAQVRVNVNVGAPVWGPAVGPNVEYYYIPEIDGYYNIYSQQYVYLDNGYWVSSPYLPPIYAGYDPRFFHPVVIDYRGRQPWSYLGNHRSVYYTRYGYASAPGWRYPVPTRVYGNRPPVIINRPYQGYNPGPGYGRGYDNRNGYVDNRGGYDNRGYGDNRGGYDNRRNDNRGPGYGDNRGGYDNRGNDNGNDRAGRNDNGNDRGRGDDRGGRNDNGGGRGRIR
ncbi:hypothetical protein [Hymenobacter cavernae]|uniref:Uncharacterized protein n=1 Tax=Hymenobacter cavernae TaxID=2044852 RepID=A0ABQ1UBU3_9BACT|nr:hypothetical protein [Hymenobacter cavernae]GGF15326.1 hypothetical protein GCM10011383_28250 [Hymenobacter cavernae]